MAILKRALRLLWTVAPALALWQSSSAHAQQPAVVKSLLGASVQTFVEVSPGRFQSDAVLASGELRLPLPIVKQVPGHVQVRLADGREVWLLRRQVYLSAGATSAAPPAHPPGPCQDSTRTGAEECKRQERKQ